MTKSALAFRCHGISSASGASDSSISELPGCRTNLEAGARPLFPLEVVMLIKAMACELPAASGLPLSHFSREDLVREAVRRGIVAQISGTTIWRWLDADAIRPWQHRSWIFPRDEHFAEKAGRVLDLYQGRWQDQELRRDEFVISADEKTSIQARVRIHPTLPPKPGEPMRVEFEYERGGALACLAAWDVRRAKIFGQCSTTTGIEPFGGLVRHVMRRCPYRKAKRVFWIVDNGSSHRGEGDERGQSADCRVGTPCVRQTPFGDIGLHLSRATLRPGTGGICRPSSRVAGGNQSRSSHAVVLVKSRSRQLEPSRRARPADLDRTASAAG